MNSPVSKAAHIATFRCIQAVPGLGLVVALACTCCGCGSGNPKASPSAENEGKQGASLQLQLLDLAGQTVDPFRASDAKAIVFVFVSNDCPISNRYAPEVRRLYEKFAPKGVMFWLVHPNTDETAEAI